MGYQREVILPKEGLDPLLYANLDPTGDEDIDEETNAGDFKVTNIFGTWWQVELQEAKEGEYNC